MFPRIGTKFDEKENKFKRVCPYCGKELGPPIYYIADCTGNSYSEYYCRDCKKLSSS